MTHPIFDEIPERYHDRVHVDSRENATVTVEDGAYTVPLITDADRHAMNLPPSRHPDRRRDDAPRWYPPAH